MKQDSAHSGLEATVSLIYCVLHFRFYLEMLAELSVAVTGLKPGWVVI